MDIRTNIWERVGNGRNKPASVIIPATEDMHAFTTSFVQEFHSVMEKVKMIPVIVECCENALDFWTNMFKSICESIMQSMCDESLKEQVRDTVDDMADVADTDGIKEELVSVLEDINEAGITILLMLEDFDQAVRNHNHPDLMKLRNVASGLSLLVVSYEQPEQLAKKLNKETYFCNQFKHYTIE